MNRLNSTHSYIAKQFITRFFSVSAKTIKYLDTTATTTAHPGIDNNELGAFHFLYVVFSQR